MADPARERITEVDRRHFDFVQTLLRISEALTKNETADVKLFCMHIIPKGRAAKLKRAVDIFRRLIELDKIDQENLDFVEEILERIGRRDLVRNVLRPFQPPDREIPENTELQPGISQGDVSSDGTETSNAYLVVHGQVHMVQETVDSMRYNLASLCGTRRSQVKFRGYKKHKSILVHVSVPRKNTAVLRHMAAHSDPRLVYMGVKSLQIDAEHPIDIKQRELLYDVKRCHSVDDIEVGCSASSKQQRAPKMWSRLSALNLFSDALPLHLQVAESLEYQGFSYSLVQALVQKDQERERKMRQVIRNDKKAEVDSNTFMTMRSKLIITENRLTEALGKIVILENELQQAREYIEKAARRVASHVTEYTGEKTPSSWPPQVEKEAHSSTPTPLAEDEGTTREQEQVDESVEGDAAESDAICSAEGAEDGKDVLPVVQTRSSKEQEQFEEEGAEGESLSGSEEHSITYGGHGSGPGEFDNPYGVVVSSDNEIFVVDRGNRRVQVHSTEGVYLRHFPTVVPGTGDKDMEPYDVTVDSNRTLWVVGEGESSHHVVQYSKDGSPMTKFDLPWIVYYRGIAVDMRYNRIVVTEAGKDRGELTIFRPDGSPVRRFGHPESEMKLPRYVTVDGEGNILVSDWATDSIYMYSESGEFLLKFGGEGSGDAQMLSPRGICTDSSGHIIVADSYNRRVQIYTHRGEHVRNIPTDFIVRGVAVGSERMVLTSLENHTVTVLFSY